MVGVWVTKKVACLVALLAGCLVVALVAYSELEMVGTLEKRKAASSAVCSVVLQPVRLVDLSVGSLVG